MEISGTEGGQGVPEADDIITVYLAVNRRAGGADFTAVVLPGSVGEAQAMRLLRDPDVFPDPVEEGGGRMMVRVFGPGPRGVAQAGSFPWLGSLDELPALVRRLEIRSPTVVKLVPRTGRH
jgi:hypothetical protein